MASDKNKINPFQLAFILLHGQIGVGMITLASDVHTKAKTDSWISVIIAGLIIQIIIFLFGLLTRCFPNETLYEMIEIIFGKIIGKIIIFVYAIYFMFVGAILLAKFIVILKSWMMPLTPKWILVATILIVSVYAAKENLHIIVRFFILATAVIFLFWGFVFYSFKDANVTYILPIASTGMMPILKGAFTSTLAFQGFEYVLFLAPLTKATNRQVVIVSSTINIFVTIFYTFIVLAIQLFFSSEELKLITEPIFYLIKSFSFKIIERPDLIFTSLWIVLVVTTLVIILYVISLGLQTVFLSRNRTILVYIAMSIIFIITSFINGETQVSEVSKIFTSIIASLSVGFPIILLLLSYLFKKRGGKSK